MFKKVSYVPWMIGSLVFFLSAHLFAFTTLSPWSAAKDLDNAIAQESCETESICQSVSSASQTTLYPRIEAMQQELSSYEPEHMGEPLYQMATDSLGNKTAIWVSSGILYTTTQLHGGGWSQPIALSHPEQKVLQPQMSLSHSGVVVVVYQTLNGSLMSAVRALNGNWETEDMGHQGAYPHVSVNPAGRIVALWDSEIGDQKSFKFAESYLTSNNASEHQSEEVFSKLENDADREIADESLFSLIQSVQSSPLFIDAQAAKGRHKLSSGNVQPPSHLKGYQTVNRFVAQTDVINVIAWSSPSSGPKPAFYEVYSNASLSKLLVRISSHEKLKYKDHDRKKHHTYTYYVVSVDKSGNRSAAVGIVFKGAKTHLINPTPEAVSLSVAPQNEEIDIGELVQYAAIATFEDDSTEDVTQKSTWNSSNTAVAIVSSSGLAEGLGDGSTDITAQFGSLSAQSTLTVNGVITSLVISPSQETIDVGQSVTYLVEAIYSDGSREDVTASASWSSSNATVASVNNSGVAIGLSDGTVQITASFETFSAQATLTVQGTIVSIQVLPKSVQIAQGMTQQYTAFATYSDGSTEDITGQVTWISTKTSVATINAQGLSRAIDPGTTTIKASLGAVSGQESLSVTNAVITNLKLTPSSAFLDIHDSEQFVATATYSNGTTIDTKHGLSVVWSSSNSHVVTIDQAGIAAGQAAGSATISAAVEGKTAHANVSVSSATLDRITLAPIAAVIDYGESVKYVATGHYSDGSTLDTEHGFIVRWSAGDESVATIDQTGVAIARKASANTLIFARSGAVQGQATLTVDAAVIVSIALIPPSVTLPNGVSQQFIAEATYNDGHVEPITLSANWSSNNESVVSVDNGSNKGKAVAQNTGSAQISATFGGITGSASVTVGAAEIQKIDITPVNPRLYASQMIQLIATATYTDGSTSSTADPDPLVVQWESDNVIYATVSASGVALAQNSGGVANISATADGITGSTLVTIAAATITSVAVNPPSAELYVNDTVQFGVSARYSDGTVLTESDGLFVSWSSIDPSIAFINDTGLATALNTGTTSVIAQLLGTAISGNAPVTVPEPKLTQIDVTANVSTPYSIYTGQTLQFKATGTYSDGNKADLTESVMWLSNDTDIATVGDSSANKGLATGINPGTVIISATADNITGEATLEIKNVVAVSLDLDVTTLSLYPSQSHQFVATATYNDGTTKNTNQGLVVRWESDLPNAVMIGSNGIAIASDVGQAHITAYLDGGSSLSKTALVSVQNVSITSLSVTPNTSSIRIGQTTTPYVATATYSDSHQLSTTDTPNPLYVTWTSSDANIASIDQSAIAWGQKTGSVIITAASSTHVQGSATLNVSSVTVTSLAIWPPAADIWIDGTIQYTATATYSDGSTLDTDNGLKVDWVPLPYGGQASINSTGLTTGVASGAVRPYAEISGISSPTSSLNVFANRVVQSATITPSNTSVIVGGTVQYQCTVVYTDGSVQSTIDGTLNIKGWYTHDTGIATINSTTGLATGVSSGNTIVDLIFNASQFGQSLLYAQTKLIVVPDSLVSITISPEPYGTVNPPSTISLDVGEKVQFVATGHYASGAVSQLTTGVTWKSNRNLTGFSMNGLTGILTVASGAVSTQSAQITAEYSSITSAPYTVTYSPLDSVVVTPSSVTLVANQNPKPSQQFTATGHYNNGSSRDMTNTGSVTWSSSLVNLATINQAGLLQVINNTLTTQIVTVEALSYAVNGQNGTATVTVNP